MSEDFITMTIGKQKNIALIAHDNKKADLIDWCEQNKEILKQHFLCGTGTTARMITDQTGLPAQSRLHRRPRSHIPPRLKSGAGNDIPPRPCAALPDSFWR